MLFPFSFMKTVPVAPVATAATGVGETSFTANWNAFTGATYYLLDVSTSPSFSSFVLQDEFTTSTSYVVIGLTASTTYYYRVRANVGVDPDAQAFFDRVTTAGGTLSATEQTATNQLVLDMKAAGIWTKMKAVYPMVGASAAACAQNLKSSSFTGTFTSGWTFASTGVTGNGTSAYLDSNFLPSVQSTNNNTHISFYSRSNIQEARAEMGVWKSGDVRWSMELNYYLNGVSYGFASDQYNYSTGRVSNANTNSQGFYIGSRTNSTTHKAFKNNAQLGTTNTGNSGNVSNIDANMYICSVNANPISYSSKECAFASIGDGLTDTQASNFYTAVQTFNQTLNRQVGPQIVSDADAQAYINRVYTAGGTLTNTEANAVNQLTIDMKAAGIWTAMKAVYPMVGASAAACAQNLKSSSFTGSFTSGWTFSSTGVTPNGTSAYFDTGLQPTTQLTGTSTHVSYYSRTNTTTNGGVEIGSWITGYSNGIELALNRSIATPKTYLTINSSAGVNTVSGGNQTSTGLFVGCRTSTSLASLYRNGSSIGTNTNLTTPSLSSFNIYLGASNDFGTAGAFSTKQCAFASIGDGLTDTQASNFYTAVQAFQTTLSRQV